MATEQQLMQALRKADAAGDAAAAEQFAGMIKRMRSESSSKSAPTPKSATWGQTLRDIPAAAGRNLADMALGIGPNAYNLVGMAVSAPLVAAGMDPSRAFQPIEQARVPDYTPQSMTDAQSAVHKGGQFAVEAALLPGQAARSGVQRGMGLLRERSENAALAGLGGAAGDVAGKEYGLEGELIANVLAPVGAVTGVKTLGLAANKLTDAAALADVASTRTGLGEARIMKNIVRQAASESPVSNDPAIREALTSGTEYVQGMRPTVTQSLSQGRAETLGAPQIGGGLIGLEKQLAGTETYQTRMGERTANLGNEMADIAGGASTAERRAARRATRQQRSNETGPMFERARNVADQGRRAIEGRFDDLGAAVNRGDIDINQARTELARMSVGDFPSLQASPIIDRLSMMISDDATGGLTKRLLRSVRKDLLDSVDDATGTLSGQKLQTVRAELNEKIEGLIAGRGEDAVASKRAATGASKEVKNLIDSAVESAGAGPEWNAALDTYRQYSTDLDRMKVSDLLARSLTPEPGRNQVNPDQFLKWTGDDQEKLLRKAKIDPESSNLRDLLGPEEFNRIMNIRREVLRDQVAQKTKVDKKSDFYETPQAINVLDPKIALFNLTLRLMSEGNRAEIVNKLADVMASDPALVANMLKANRQGIPVTDLARTVPELLEYSDNKLAQSLEQ